MADFCRQCSLETFGDDIGDLQGLCDKDEIIQTLCEGCGPIYVDHNGSCVGDHEKTCFKKHEESNNG